ncbi:helix-turn-helix transcriptional regulator [Sphaerotilus microaerophilus]|uniref:HTH araC/xylS-type domain-containing protein n=1 Tax=Sphaerotilus microaerophilus TaxID=2914710 RepID=A0ABN6PFE9_9BURK|nr:helix-turn-helix transcriptional regulator [Sphaerotilus sp. FB-5]BDI03397.1 hypothetical protein CATMQ487_03670 [Sphaerotilus sp. FB-5]
MTSRKQLTQHLADFDRLAGEPVAHQLAWAEPLRPLFLAQRDPLLKARFLLKLGSLSDTVQPVAQVTDDLLLALRIFRTNDMALEAARCLARLAYWHNRRGLHMAALLAGRMALAHHGLSLSERTQLVIPMCLALAAQRHLPQAWVLLEELTASTRARLRDPRSGARIDGARASLHFVEALRAAQIPSLYCLDLPSAEPDRAASNRHLQACERHLQAYERAGLASASSIGLRAMSGALRGDTQAVQAGLGATDAARGADALSEAVRLYNFGWSLRVLGHIEPAYDACCEALERLRHYQDNRTLLMVHYELSVCARASGDLDAAHRHLSDHVRTNARLAMNDLDAAQALVAGTKIPPPESAAASGIGGLTPTPAAHLRATEPPCLQRALQLQHSQLPRRLPLAHIAARVGVSLRTLQAAAQSYRGMTLTEMLRRSLMAEALPLLGDTDLSLREIASRCGYDDPSAFSRDFKRVYGMAPSVHRATLRGAVAAG